MSPAAFFLIGLFFLNPFLSAVSCVAAFSIF